MAQPSSGRLQSEEVISKLHRGSSSNRHDSVFVIDSLRWEGLLTWFVALADPLRSSRPVLECPIRFGSDESGNRLGQAFIGSHFLFALPRVRSVIGSILPEFYLTHNVYLVRNLKIGVAYLLVILSGVLLCRRCNHVRSQSGALASAKPT